MNEQQLSELAGAIAYRFGVQDAATMEVAITLNTIVQLLFAKEIVTPEEFMVARMRVSATIDQATAQARDQQPNPETEAE